MKPIDSQPVLRLIVADPLAALTHIGAMGRVYALAEPQAQAMASLGADSAGSPIPADGETHQAIKNVKRKT
jgi:hypothetical protein